MNVGAVLLLITLTACEPISLGGGSAPVLGRDPEQIAQCRARTRDTVTPLFAPGPAETGPIVTTRADGTLVTTIGGRVHGRHEREQRYAPYDTRYFENRSHVLTIEDGVAAGRSEIIVTYQPNADVSPTGTSTNFRSWKVYGPTGNMNGGYTFHVNQTMTQVTPRQLTHRITTNGRANRAMQVGDVLDFELGIYLSGAGQADPAPITGGSTYFSDTYRYQVGVGGLTPENFDSVGLLGPSVDQRAGGGLTISFHALADGTLVEPTWALSQLGLAAQPPHHQQFLEGRRVFHTDFDTGANTENGNPAFSTSGVLGPAEQAKSCVECHRLNGRGTPPTDATYDDEPVTLADGTVVTLRKPRTSTRLAPPLVGLGLLEALDESAVLDGADPADCDGDGISGRPALVGSSLGRFGWKGQTATLETAVTDELATRLGVTSAELAADHRARLLTYLRTLGVMPHRPTDARGAEAFASAGCAACHREAFTTAANHPFEELRGQVVRPYSDLLLHDLGESLRESNGDSNGYSEWRTEPLWSVALQPQSPPTYLHDGRARTVLEAILWHGGEAKASRDSVVAMSSADRTALVEFVESR